MRGLTLLAMGLAGMAASGAYAEECNFACGRVISLSTGVAFVQPVTGLPSPVRSRIEFAQNEAAGCPALQPCDNGSAVARNMMEAGVVQTAYSTGSILCGAIPSEPPRDSFDEKFSAYRNYFAAKTKEDAIWTAYNFGASCK